MTTDDDARAAWEQRAADRAKALGSVRTAADSVQILGWLTALGGLVVGVVLAAFVTEDSGGFIDDKTYPNVGVGLAVAASSVVVGAVMLLLAAWASAWARAVD